MSKKITTIPKLSKKERKLLAQSVRDSWVGANAQNVAPDINAFIGILRGVLKKRFKLMPDQIQGSIQKEIARQDKAQAKARKGSGN